MNKEEKTPVRQQLLDDDKKIRIKKYILEKSGKKTLPEEMKIMSAMSACPTRMNEWECIITIEAENIDRAIPVDNVAKCVLDNLKSQYEEWYNFGGHPMEDIYLSRSDMTLIEPHTNATFKDGEILYVNHIKRDGNWKLVYSFVAGLDDETNCGWCNKRGNYNIRCKGCTFVKYCSSQHQQIALHFHESICKTQNQRLKRKPLIKENL